MSLYDTQPIVDPYAETPMDVVNSEPMNGAGNGHPSDSHRRSRSRSPRRDDRSPPPKRSSHAQQGKAPEPSSVLGVFGLSIRTQERDLDEEFSRHGSVEKVTIVYDQRSDRSRGFGFIRMATVEDATKCIEELNGVELHGRRLRVDYSMTNKPHNPTPGEYMGRKSRDYDRRDRRDYRDDYRDRGGYRGSSSGYGRDRDRDGYGRDRDWKDRRSPPPRDRDYRRRRSYSRSPPRGSSPRRDDDRRW